MVWRMVIRELRDGYEVKSKVWHDSQRTPRYALCNIQHPLSSTPIQDGAVGQEIDKITREDDVVKGANKGRQFGPCIVLEVHLLAARSEVCLR